MATGSHELDSFPPTPPDGDPSPAQGDEVSMGEMSTGVHESSLPPVDSGKDAWFFLAACFALEALTWGK